MILGEESHEKIDTIISPGEFALLCSPFLFGLSCLPSLNSAQHVEMIYKSVILILLMPAKTFGKNKNIFSNHIMELAKSRQAKIEEWRYKP